MQEDTLYMILEAVRAQRRSLAALVDSVDRIERALYRLAAARMAAAEARGRAGGVPRRPQGPGEG